MVSMAFCTSWPLPRTRTSSAPENAAGMEPSISQRTTSRRTVPRLRWTAPPMGFITTAATRSLETAASG